MSKIFPTGDIEAAIAEFEQALPGWWHTVGSCQVSADASCAPTVLSPHIEFAESGNPFDAGFHCDDGSEGATLASSLRDVMAQALEAIAKAGTRE